MSILTYHDPRPDRFETHLHYLASRYSFVSLSRVADALKSGEWHALPNFPLVLTFDDGWRGNTELAEICRRFECPITIYISSQIVDTGRHYWSTKTEDKARLMTLPSAERNRVLAEEGIHPSREYDASDRQTMTLEEMREMSDVASFGSHTRFHPPLPTCTDDEAYEEIAVSKTEIETLLGKDCTHFAFPYGDHTVRDQRMVAKAGYRTARTIDVGWNDPRADPYELKAIGVPDDAPVSRLAAELAGIGFLLRWKYTRRLDGRKPTIPPATTAENAT